MLNNIDTKASHLWCLLVCEFGILKYTDNYLNRQKTIIAKK